MIYSDNGYELFKKLSNIAHGNSDEETALRSYEPLRRLVVGVIENVKKKEEEIKHMISLLMERFSFEVSSLFWFDIIVFSFLS